MIRPPKASGRKLVRITHTSRRRAMYAARRWTVLRNRWEFEAETRRQESHAGDPHVEHNNSEIAEGQFFAIRGPKKRRNEVISGARPDVRVHGIRSGYRRTRGQIRPPDTPVVVYVP